MKLRPEAVAMLLRSHLGQTVREPPDAAQLAKIFAPAKPMPGVVPRDWQSSIPMATDTSFNDAINQMVMMTGGTENLQWLGYPYLSELAQRAEYRMINETVAREMCRKWIKITARQDGSFTVVNSRNGFARTYGK